jgi:hypothetical protein
MVREQGVFVLRHVMRGSADRVGGALTVSNEPYDFGVGKVLVHRLLRTPRY